jgi:hypothetical protein
LEEQGFDETFEAYVAEGMAKFVNNFDRTREKLWVVESYVRNESGKRIYSGTYHGNRQSGFPIVSEIDIQESLASSMADAISSLAEDESLTALLSSEL